MKHNTPTEPIQPAPGFMDDELFDLITELETTYQGEQP